MKDLKLKVEERIAILEKECKDAMQQVSRQDVYIESRRSAFEHCSKCRAGTRVKNNFN